VITNCKRAAFAAASFFALCTAASANPITRTYDFTVSSVSGSGPTLPVTGQVTATFDPLLGTQFDLTTITLNSYNQAFAGPIQFDYVSAVDALCFGGSNGGTCGLSGDGTADFALTIHGATTASPSFFDYRYQNGSKIAFTSSSTQGSVSLVAVPEPLTLSLFGTGLAGAIATRRRKKQA